MRGGHQKDSLLLTLGAASTLDLGDLFGDAPAKKGGATLVDTMRASHHELARLIAEGRKEVEVAAMTGFSQSRISTLKGSPAFQELLSFYQEKKEAIYVDTHEKIASLGNESLDALRDDLHDGLLTPSQKIEIAKLTLDRSGHGVQTKNTSVNFNLPMKGEVMRALVAAVPHQGKVQRLDDITQSPDTAIAFRDPLRVAAPTPHEIPAGQESRDGEPVLEAIPHSEDETEGSAWEGDLI